MRQRVTCVVVRFPLPHDVQCDYRPAAQPFLSHSSCCSKYRFVFVKPIALVCLGVYLHIQAITGVWGFLILRTNINLSGLVSRNLCQAFWNFCSSQLSQSVRPYECVNKLGLETCVLQNMRTSNSYTSLVLNVHLPHHCFWYLDFSTISKYLLSICYYFILNPGYEILTWICI
jgi:hypothetical protein